jgi:hypothetical protein
MKDKKIKDDDYKYERDIPSPVALDYPYRNLTRIVGSIPSSLSVDETKDRINDYYNAIKNEKLLHQESRINELAKDSWASILGGKPSDEDIAEIRKQYLTRMLPLESFRKLQNDITNSYLDDISKNEKDLNKLKDIIAKDFEWSDLDKSLVDIKTDTDKNETDITGMLHVDDKKHPSPSIPRIFTKTSNMNNEQLNPRSTLFHEMLHAENSLKNEPMHTYSMGQLIPEYEEEYLDPQDDRALKTAIDKNILIDQDPFMLSEFFNSTRHHMPIELKGKYEPTILMRPFVKAGMPTENTLLNKTLSVFSPNSPDRYMFQRNSPNLSSRWRNIKKLVEE